MRAYLYLPKNAAAPFQTVIYFPPGGPRLQSSRKLGLRYVDFMIRSGRAVMFPIYQGMYERGASTQSGPTAARDLRIMWSKEIGRSIDYLETRRDIDHARIAYYGFSTGAVLGPIMTALEPRFKASILLGGGVGGTPQPPDIEPINFAPRVHVPTLMWPAGRTSRGRSRHSSDRSSTCSVCPPTRSDWR